MKKRARRAVKLAVSLLFAVPAILAAAGTPASIALTASPDPSVFGRPLTLVAVVAPPTATGNVTFYDGATLLGTARLTAGRASLTTILLPSGVRSLKAYYSGDTNYAPGTSAPLAQTVDAMPGSGFQAAVSYGAGVAPHSVAVGDFNGDGDADLVVANESSRVSVLLGNGDGTFQAAVNYAAGVIPYSVAVGDFNGDGKADIAVANQGGSNVSVLLGNGDGTFRAAVNYGAGFSPGAIAVADFNGDGKADLAVVNIGGNNVSVLLGNGDGTFQTALNYGAGATPISIAVADFNGDGIADIAVANESTTSNVNVLLGNGDGTFQSPVDYGAGWLPVSIAAGDFNGDGRADLVVGNYQYGVSVLLGNGDGTFQFAANLTIEGSAFFAVTVGDFNGDGRADIAVANSGANSVSVLLGKGDGTFFLPEVSNAVGPSPSSIAVGDFDGNGRADLVTPNSRGNDVSVLLAAAPFPELSTAVFHSGVFTGGQSGATYTIAVSNIGAATTTGAVAVTDSLPPGLTATAIGGIGWTCILATLTCTREDPLAPVASYPAITVTVMVAMGAAGGLTNTVTVSGGGPGSVANGASTDYVTTFTPSQVSQAWSVLTPPTPSLSAPLLMTDGTVMIHQSCSGSWYRLTPDNFGNYARGVWTKAASMPSGYGPLYFSSAVLADGRLVVIGGEYNVGGANNACTAVWTALGAISPCLKSKNVWL